jgi:hypothetical protein
VPTECDEDTGAGPGVPDLTDAIDAGRGTLWLVIVRLLFVLVSVAVVRLGLGIWHGLTVATLIVGAAWLLGRVD